MTKKRFILLLALAGVLGGAGWLLLGNRFARRARPNVVLISLDTCRADHLSCYGRFAHVTPNIDAVAKEGVLFSHVVSPAPLTLPAHSSMLTGILPPSHGVHDNISYRLGESSVTLPEVLKKEGYATAAIVSTFVLDARFGLAQGFDLYDDEVSAEAPAPGALPERRGDEVTRLATKWLDENESQPFFLFLHYYDAHDPYDPPNPFASIFADDPYLGEVAFVDQCVGRVIDKLKELNLYESTLLIITGDHGEGLGQHGETKHGYFIYHTTTKVPLIVKPPGRREAARVERKVTLVDIMPTVLSQVGAPAPENMDGQDLSPLLAGDTGEAPQRYIYSEARLATKYGCSSLLAVETDDWKYIQTTLPELYHLSVDADEANNLFAQEPERAKELQDQLRVILDRAVRAERGDTSQALDAAALARLKTLGYTGGGVDETFEFDTTKPDPKEFLEVFTKIELADFHLNQGDRAEARTLCEEILAARPTVGHIHAMLGRIATEEKNDAEAIDHFTEALRINSDRPGWHNHLGILLTRGGRFDEAEKHFQDALRIIMRGVSEPDDADPDASTQGHDDPAIFDVRFNLGTLRLRQGRFEEAVQEYRDAIRIKPDAPNAHFQLGVALTKQGKTNKAADAYRRTLQLDPDHASAKRALESAP